VTLHTLFELIRVFPIRCTPKLDIQAFPGLTVRVLGGHLMGRLGAGLLGADVSRVFLIHVRFSAVSRFA
jgi:hypothetical protein